jgi:hypothetical protein
MSFYLLHRGWMENEVFSDEPFCDRLAWLWLIQEASFEPHRIRYKNEMVDVGIGQVPTSYRRLVEKWKWGIHRVRNFLLLLESEQMITRQTATGFLIITVSNYEKYQKPSKLPTTQTATPTATLPTTQTATNIKNIKNLNKEYMTKFSEFWTAYPRKTNKHAGEKAYLKALKEIDHETLVASAARFAAYHIAKGTELEFIPHASTWLNGKRWGEDYTTPKPKHSETRSGAIVL